MAQPDTPSIVNVDAYSNVDHLFWDSVPGATSYNIYKTANKCPNDYFPNQAQLIKRWSFVNDCVANGALTITVPVPVPYSTAGNVVMSYDYWTHAENDFEIIIDVTDYQRLEPIHTLGPRFYFGISSELGDVTAGFRLQWNSGLGTKKYYLKNWGLPIIDSPGGGLAIYLPQKYKIWRDGNKFKSDYMKNDGAWNNDTGWSETVSTEEAKQRFRIRILLYFNPTVYDSSCGGYVVLNNLIINPAPVFLKNVTGINTCVIPEEDDDTMSYAIAAKNDDGTSDLSEELFTDRTGDLLSNVPPSLSSFQVQSNIIIQWEKPVVLGMHFVFNVYYLAQEETDSDVIKLIGQKISNINSNYLIFESPDRGTTYSFVVTSVSENACLTESDASNVVTETIPLESGVTSTGKTYVGEESMQDLQRGLTYRLNIAADVNQRTDQVRFWSDAEILRAINEGYLDFTRRTMCLQKFAMIGLVAEQVEYDLPSDCIKLLWVGDGTRNLVGQSLAYMDDLDEGWLTRDGTPAYYVQELAGIKKFNLYETPETSGISTFTADTNDTAADADHGLIVGLEQDDTAVTFTADSNHTEADADHGIVINITGEPVLLSEEKETGIFVKLDQQTANLTILYAYEPVLFNNLQEAQTPDFLAAYHIAIVNFAISELYLKEGETQNIPLSDFYRGLYEDAVQSKLETMHVSNLKLVKGGSPAYHKMPPGPHLPYDTYPAN